MTSSGSTPPVDRGLPPTMQAYVQDGYGAPGTLRIESVPTPVAREGRVLVHVRAASLNVYDLHMTSGRPFMIRAMAGLTRPKNRIPGADLAGEVAAVGEGVTEFEIGDEVFGETAGAFAEYAPVRAGNLWRKPAGVDFIAAAATPMAGLTALQGLRDMGGVQPGSRVIVNGASGGVGTFAVQVAKALGAEVTAVCSTSKVDQARRIGADRVIDYTAADYTATEREYDVLFDNVGNLGWRRTSRVLKSGGVNVAITGPKHAVLGPMRNLLVRRVGAAFSNKRLVWFTARVDQDDLATLAGWVEAGQIEPVVERTYQFAELPAALGYLGEGHAHGKLVVTV